MGASLRLAGTGAIVLLGAFVAVLAASTLFGLAYPATDRPGVEATKSEPDEGGSSVEPVRRASPVEIRAYLNDMFDRLDRDGSGYVEPAEAPRQQVMSTRLADGTIRQWPLTQAEWSARGDGDRDGRVSRTEYFSRLLPPVQLMFGVPANWNPSERERRTSGSQNQ